MLIMHVTTAIIPAQDLSFRNFSEIIV